MTMAGSISVERAAIAITMAITIAAASADGTIANAVAAGVVTAITTRTARVTAKPANLLPPTGMVEVMVAAQPIDIRRILQVFRLRLRIVIL